MGASKTPWLCRRDRLVAVAVVLFALPGGRGRWRGLLLRGLLDELRLVGIHLKGRLKHRKV